MSVSYYTQGKGKKEVKDNLTHKKHGILYIYKIYNIYIYASCYQSGNQLKKIFFN